MSVACFTEPEGVDFVGNQCAHHQNRPACGALKHTCKAPRDVAYSEVIFTKSYFERRMKRKKFQEAFQITRFTLVAEQGSRPMLF